MSPFCMATDTSVLDFWWTSLLSFKARVDPLLVCFAACVHWIPEIHLWCDTCWPLDGQHDSWSYSPTCYICSRGRMPGFNLETSRTVSGHAVHSATVTGKVCRLQFTVLVNYVGFENYWDFMNGAGYIPTTTRCRHLLIIFDNVLWWIEFSNRNKLYS